MNRWIYVHQEYLIIFFYGKCISVTIDQKEPLETKYFSKMIKNNRDIILTVHYD